MTNNALVGLHKLGYLKDYRVQRGDGTSTRYFIHRSNRYPVRQVGRLEAIVEAYARDDVTRGCGHRAEDLFCKAFAMHGFMPRAEKVREWRDRKWEKTGHDLDYIFERDGVEYGCEIKNTLGYIEKVELDVKLEMCSFFGVRPLFIMRYSPKSYNWLIAKQGGFALLFEAQIYELGQVGLVKLMEEELGLPVICSKAIPDGIISVLRSGMWVMSGD